MEARLKEIEIIEGAPFENCKLGRGIYAKILTKVVKQYINGCVFAIDGNWGCGKTTFVKMWKQSLIDEGFSTLYFNVWQDDFISDPLVGLLGQLKSLQKSDEENNTFENVCELATGIINWATNGALKNITEGTALCERSMSQNVEDYISKQNTLSEFKESIISYIDDCTRNKNTQNEFKPIIFFIDELDRCCPSYAVKVLERIKHLFDIPNIVFVLSIDKGQLSNSIRGYYGSDLIDANEYLKRFIDIEYTLPEPNVHDFCSYLYEIYGFDDFFNTPARLDNFGQHDGKDEFLRMLEIIFDNLHYNLRQMEKACAHMRLILTTFAGNNYVTPGLLIILTFFRDKKQDYYKRIYEKNIPIEELISFFETTFPKNSLIENDYNYSIARTFIWTIAHFLVNYSMDRRGELTYPLLDSKSNLLFTCNVIKEESMKEAVQWYLQYGRQRVGVFDLNYLIEHIELLKDVQSL